MNVFDIETGPRSDTELQALCPDVAHPPRLGEFDPDSVKLGNLKDQAKIDTKIEDARKKHEAAAASYERDCKSREAAAFQEFKSKAALDPITGVVLAIGYQNVDTGKYVLDVDNEEAVLLANFWVQFEKMRSSRRSLVGHYIYGFDLPFIINRSRILAIDFPSCMNMRGSYCNFDDIFVDTHAVWSLGRRGCMGSLDAVSTALGGPGKPEGTTGADFAELLKTDQSLALAYLKNDLDMTAFVASRLGIA